MSFLIAWFWSSIISLLPTQANCSSEPSQWCLLFCLVHLIFCWLLVLELCFLSKKRNSCLLRMLKVCSWLSVLATSFWGPPFPPSLVKAFLTPTSHRSWAVLCSAATSKPADAFLTSHLADLVTQCGVEPRFAFAGFPSFGACETCLLYIFWSLFSMTSPVRKSKQPLQPHVPSNFAGAILSAILSARW